ncbi:MAG: thymidylate kinase [Planctomycetaceae bacterium]
MLIAIEGIDGSGKGTQTARLAETLRREGRSVATLGFPRYAETFFGARIGEFLNGRFGSLAEVDPFLVSLLFAGDRFESKQRLLDAIAEHDVVLLDRYVASNIAHQSCKAAVESRGELREWIERIEYDIYGLPRADRVILLDIPAEVSRELVARKAPRDYTDQMADLQEADSVYQASVREVYRALAATDERWRTIDVTRDGELRTLDEVAADVRAAADCG